MPDMRQEIEAAAIGWLIRLRDGTAEDWQQFAAWLEADPAHGPAYDEIALADDALGELPPARSEPVVPAEEEASAGWLGRRAFLGWSIAAALVATAGYVSLRPSQDLQAIVTAPGERRSLTLADGSRVDLNGSTRLLIDRNNPRFASLAEGEALFRMAHDPSRLFEVEARDVQVRVIGTIFNVAHAEGGVEVAVAEGTVLLNPDGEAATLTAGMAARVESRGTTIGRRDPAEVGGWTQSRLIYSSAPLARIAADLSRNLGVRIEASANVADKRFTGVIVLAGDRERLVRRVAALLGVKVRRSGDGWLLTS